MIDPTDTQAIDRVVALVKGMVEVNGLYRVPKKGSMLVCERYSPSTNPAQAMELLGEIPLDVYVNLDRATDGYWLCRLNGDYIVAPTYQAAICLTYLEWKKEQAE